MHLSFCFVRNAYKSKIYFSLAMHLNKNYAPKIGFYNVGFWMNSRSLKQEKNAFCFRIYLSGESNINVKAQL